MKKTYKKPRMIVGNVKVENVILEGSIERDKDPITSEGEILAPKDYFGDDDDDSWSLKH